MAKIIAILVSLFLLCTGCGSDTKNSSSGNVGKKTSVTDVLNKPLNRVELENLRRDSEKYLAQHPDNLNHKMKIDVIDYHLKRDESVSEQQIIDEVEQYKNHLAKQVKEQVAAEQKAKQENMQVFQYSNFTLNHNYDPVLPYNGIEISFVVQNTSDSTQTLRLSDFILQKPGSNTILPQEALRKYTGIARNPDNPDFTDYDKDLNQREMYPGDRFLVKIEFWEQRELIRSMEGWCLVHRYKDKARNICSLHD